jgi:hypothetical protein
MSNNDTYTLDDIHKILGVPTELQAKANAPRESDAELIKLGAQIASDRILTDVDGLYSLAYVFWIKATEAQKSLLTGFSEGVLRYAVDRALALRDLTSTASGSGFMDTKEIARRKKVAADAFSDGVSLRDRARNTLKKAAPDVATIDIINNAVGTAEDDEKLAAALERFAGIGEKMLSTQDEVAKARLEEVRLTKTFMTELTDAAKKVRKTAQDAATQTTVKHTTQGDIDRLDGVNLVILKEMVHTFEDAHDKDPSIPRLVPNSTRRLLGGKKAKPTTEDKTKSEEKKS